MLTASFRHIQGVGALRERQLWQLGVHRWEGVPAEGEMLSAALDARVRKGVAASQTALDAGDLDHFARLLPPTEHWRFLPHVLDGAACVDIEAGDSAADLAVVGVLDAQGVRAFVGGHDLHHFPARAKSWTAMITFNGLGFDLPILQRAFPAWVPPLVQIDLRFAYARLREPGGLKQLEARLGFFRPPHLAKLTGADAVALWRAQRQGEAGALRRLIEYNLYDTSHLRPLAELAYNRLVRRLGMPAPELPVTDRGALLYDVTRAVEAACSTLAAGASKGPR